MFSNFAVGRRNPRATQARTKTDHRRDSAST